MNTHAKPYTLSEVADRWDMSRATVQRLIRSGKLPCLRITNMGKWHIDHIRPLASFDITGPHCLEFKAAWALSNLQPLWGIDNSRKWAFMPELGVTSVDNFDGEAEKSLQEQECHRSGSNGRPPDYKSVCRPTQPARIANKYGRQA